VNLNWPETDDLLHAVQQAMLPGMLAAAVTFGLVRAVAGQRLSPLAGALAMAAGMATANYFRGTIPFDLTDSKRLLWLLPLVGLVVELVARLPRVTAPAGWVLRTQTALVAAWLLTPRPLHEQSLVIVLVIANLMLLLWALGTTLTEQLPGSEVPLALAALLNGVGWVVLYAAHYASLADWAVICGAATLGVALVAWCGKSPASGVVPVFALMGPGLLVRAYPEVTNNRQLICYAALALGCAALALLLIPKVGSPRPQRLTVLRASLLILLPLLTACLLTMVFEDTPEDE